MQNTIFALASAQGRAGVAVLRISGPQARHAVALCVPQDALNPREASLRKIRNSETGVLIDEALVLWFPAPHSFTGEDIIEFHVHGGRAIVNALVDALSALPGFRLAEAGEFTRRAFENGRLDLTEAEAIADLVNAETEAQRRQAMRQYGGELGRLYEEWRVKLTRALAHLEAAIDFSDEDLPEDMEQKQADEIRALIGAISQHLDDHRRGEHLREGFSIAILGPPNAGKSSLLNALVRREAAIVSSTAGTTRDVIEAHLDLGGYPVTFADTAGLRETADEIESEGVRRALDRAEQADLKLLLFDGAKWPHLDEKTRRLADENALFVVSKTDVLKGKTLSSPGMNPLFISAQSGQGIKELLDRLIEEIDVRFASSGGAPPLTRARHRAALEECRDHLQRALKARAAELRAEDVRLASRALGRITGSVDVEDLLDVIFRDFCIGK